MTRVPAHPLYEPSILQETFMLETGLQTQGHKGTPPWGHRGTLLGATELPCQRPQRNLAEGHRVTLLGATKEPCRGPQRNLAGGHRSPMPVTRFLDCTTTNQGLANPNPCSNSTGSHVALNFLPCESLSAEASNNLNIHLAQFLIHFIVGNIWSPPCEIPRGAARPQI